MGQTGQQRFLLGLASEHAGQLQELKDEETSSTGFVAQLGRGCYKA